MTVAMARSAPLDLTSRPRGNADDRIQAREDGIAWDQFILSASEYAPRSARLRRAQRHDHRDRLPPGSRRDYLASLRAARKTYPLLLTVTDDKGLSPPRRRPRRSARRPGCCARVGPYEGNSGQPRCPQMPVMVFSFWAFIFMAAVSIAPEGPITSGFYRPPINCAVAFSHVLKAFGIFLSEHRHPPLAQATHFGRRGEIVAGVGGSSFVTRDDLHVALDMNELWRDTSLAPAAGWSVTVVCTRWTCLNVKSRRSSCPMPSSLT